MAQFVCSKIKKGDKYAGKIILLIGLEDHVDISITRGPWATMAHLSEQL